MKTQKKMKLGNTEDILTRNNMVNIMGGTLVVVDPNAGRDARMNGGGGSANASKGNSGGPNYGYWPLSSPVGGDAANDANELQYAAQAVWNLGVMAVNGMAWIGNQLPKQGTFHVEK